MEIALVMFAVVVVFTLGSMALLAWGFYQVIRLAGRGIRSLTSSGARSLGLTGTANRVMMYQCGRPACNALNPDDAVFCRRCGKKLDLSGRPVRVKMDDPRGPAVAPSVSAQQRAGSVGFANRRPGQVA